MVKRSSKSKRHSETERSARQSRDDFLFEALQSAGIPLIAFPVYRTYDGRKIKQRILAAITAQRRYRSSRHR